MTNNDDQGATPKELLLEAARRDNTALLVEVLQTNHSPEFLNKSTDALGNTALHIAAQHGSYAVIDELLDLEGLEVDPVNKLEHDTPLHKAAQLAKDQRELGLDVVELLLEAGADPRIFNKQNQKPINIVDPDYRELRSVLEKAEYMITAGNDVLVGSDDDDGDEHPGSGSESDT